MGRMKVDEELCRPPQTCFNCPYDDCKRPQLDNPTKEERKYLKLARLPRRIPKKGVTSR